MSDLHLEFMQLDPKDMEPADVIILAGDIQVWTIAGTTMFEWMNLLPTDHVIFTPGNHEFYNRGNITKIKSEMEMVLVNYPKIDMLWNSKVEIKGQTFIGTPLWSNFDKGNQYVMNLAENGISDFGVSMWNERTFWTPQKMMEENFIAEKYLEENVVTGNEIVITHWAPSYTSGDSQFIGDSLNGYFTNAMDHFIEILGPSVWVHGHCHNTSDYRIGDTRILCNPRGYAPNAINEDFNVNKFFED